MYKSLLYSGLGKNEISCGTERLTKHHAKKAYGECDELKARHSRCENFKAAGIPHLKTPNLKMPITSTSAATYESHISRANAFCFL
jgi:hypothetical protein